MVSLRNVALAIGLLAAPALAQQQNFQIARNPSTSIDNFATQHSTQKVNAELVSRVMAMDPSVAEEHNNQGRPQQAISYLSPNINFIYGKIKKGNRQVPRYTSLDLQSQLTIPQRQRLAHALNEYGVGFMDQNKLSFARVQYERGLALDNSNSKLHNNLGVIFSKHRNFDNAWKHYNQAIQINPRFGAPYFNMGTDYLKLGRLGDALPLFRKSSELNYKKNLSDRAVLVISSKLR